MTETPMTVSDIDARIDALGRELADLRRKRGKAVLAGEVFDDVQIAEAQRELDALTDAREDAEEVEAEEAGELGRQLARQRLQSLIDRFALAETRRVRAIGKAERSLRTLGASLAEAFAAGDEAAAALRALEPGSVSFDVPIAVRSPNREHRVGQFIGMIIAEATGLRHLGALNLGAAIPAPADASAADSWHDLEASLMAKELAGRGLAIPDEVKPA